MGINVMGPDVNESYNVFTADKQGNVRFGMAAIKGVGDGAVSEIVAERERGGRFTDIYNFVERVNLSAVNRKVIENCGLNPDEWSGLAFGFGLDRISMLKYGVNNIHILFDGDTRILSQFKK